MDRNIVVTGGAGNLGKSVVEKFKREGYRVIAVIEPNSSDEIEEADDVYEVDVTNEKSVTEFSEEYRMQYGHLDALALLVGGYAGGGIDQTSKENIEKMLQLNFFSAFNMAKYFLPIMKKTERGCFLFVGARPAIQSKDGKSVLAYALSKSILIDFAEMLAEEIKGTPIRSHIFVPSIIDTPANREAMKDQDFAKWVSPADIAEAMHNAVNNTALRNVTFKLYGSV